MKVIEHLFGRTDRPLLTRKRVWFALLTALVIDGLQFSLGPFGWFLVDEGLDVVGMVLISWAIGFHTLLLPTFVIELIPGPDMLPTWTGCTAAVIMLRKKAKPQVPPTIDIDSEVTPEAPPKLRAQAPTIVTQACAPEKLSKQN